MSLRQRRGKDKTHADGEFLCIWAEGQQCGLASEKIIRSGSRASGRERCDGTRERGHLQVDVRAVDEKLGELGVA
jgi:hypothetical protein